MLRIARKASSRLLLRIQVDQIPKPSSSNMTLRMRILSVCFLSREGFTAFLTNLPQTKSHPPCKQH